VLTELRVRGVADVLILCCDGLKGIPESVAEAWRLAMVRTCVVFVFIEPCDPRYQCTAWLGHDVTFGNGAR
jgi:hypothetical protein